MDREEAKKWAELLTAYAEGKTLQLWVDEKHWNDITSVGYDFLTRSLGCVRIKPQPKTRRMTNQELADWLRDCPQEHREYKCKSSPSIWHEYVYDELDGNAPCDDDVLVRRNHGGWEEPIIVEE